MVDTALEIVTIASKAVTIALRIWVARVSTPFDALAGREPPL
jgi:hypothetical protein